MDAADTEKLEKLLRELWRNNRTLLLERVQCMRDAQQQMAEASVDTRIRQQAREAAHKLAGVLGTFGLRRGTELALEAESLLDEQEARSAAEAARMSEIVEELETMITTKSTEDS